MKVAWAEQVLKLRQYTVLVTLFECHSWVVSTSAMYSETAEFDSWSICQYTYLYYFVTDYGLSFQYDTCIWFVHADLRPSAPKRPMRRLLKKEVSLDTYTWQKKYGHLTSSIMMAAVDERLKRRFSVSASMEEISKIPSKGNMGSQVLLAGLSLK